LDLAGTGLVLQDNGGDNLSVSASGNFTFTAINDGSAYAVTVSMQPTNSAQTCGVTNGTGTATAQRQQRDGGLRAQRMDVE
jgi:hypothetical protein